MPLRESLQNRAGVVATVAKLFWALRDRRELAGRGKVLLRQDVLWEYDGVDI
jgi:hypothetical protein